MKSVAASCELPKNSTNIDYEIKYRSFNKLVDTIAIPELKIDKDSLLDKKINFSAMPQEIISSEITITPSSKKREFQVSRDKPQSELDKILVSIASLSRDLDYLVYCEKKSTALFDLIKQKEPLPTEPLLIEDPRCFIKNQQEHLFYESLREDKLI